MTEYIINKAGAKIFKDALNHEPLNIPVLMNEKATGVIHEVLSVGFVGQHREPIATVRKSEDEVVAYLLPEDLRGWVESTMLMVMEGISFLPGKVEFGKLDGVVYAEILEKE